MATDQMVLEWQNALPSFGISYTGPKDGQVNQAFIEAMMALEGKYKAYGQVFAGNKIKMPVTEAKKKFLSEAPKSEAPKNETSVKEVPAAKPEDGSLKIWESFLSGNLPVVGKVYDGDLAGAAKKIEAVIGRAINKPASGLIWNDATKKFNTTPDDVKKALDLIQTHLSSPTSGEKQSSDFTLDQRVILMSQMLLEKK